MAEGENAHNLPHIAVIGAGYWGRNLVRNFSDLGCLGAVCDREPQRLEEWRNKNPGSRCTQSLAEILGDSSIAAVAIATPAETHFELVREALSAGKDVFVEKPLCLSFEEGNKLLQLATQQHRILMVGHLLWYHPAILRLKQLVDTGELGGIQYIYSNRLNLGKIRREENILWSFAPHDISVILGLLGEMPDAVLANGGNFLHQKIADVTVSLLSFPSGVNAHIFVSWLHPFKEQKLVVVGDRAMAVFNDVEKQDKLVLYRHSIEWKNHQPVPIKADGEVIPVTLTEPLRSECQHFLDRVTDRKPPRTDGEEGLRVLHVLQQCQAALECGSGAVPTYTDKPTQSYFVHESAFVDEDVTIGEGTKIWHFSHVLKNSRVGKNCQIGQNVVIGPNVSVGHGVKIQNNVSVYDGITLEDGVFCGPSVVFTNVLNPRSDIPRVGELNRTVVRTGATLGANCTVICQFEIGRYAFVGAGAVVTKEVPDFALVVGNPGRIVGWMCQCGVKLSWKGDQGCCPDCGQTYQKKDNRVEVKTLSRKTGAKRESSPA